MNSTKHYSFFDIQLIQPPAELFRNITSCLILAHCPMAWKHNVIHTNGTTQHIAMPSEEDRATITGSIHKSSLKFGHVVFELCEQWTDRHTHHHRLVSLLSTVSHLYYWQHCEICRKVPSGQESSVDIWNFVRRNDGHTDARRLFVHLHGCWNHCWR